VTNIPPVATPDNYAVTENTTNVLSPLTNDIVRTPGGVLSVISVSPTNGTASIIGGTNVSFIPSTNFLGTATIGYTIIDGIGGTNSSLITINVTNLAPTAFGQSLSTTENTALPITLTGSDPAGHTLTFSIVSNAIGGTLTGLNTNTGAVTYTPTNNFTGTDTFVFRVYNGYNFSSNATVTIAVTPVADLVVAQSGPTSGVAGSNLIFTVAVTNLGPAGATNVVVTNQIDPGYTFVSASAAGSTNGNHQVIWTIPVLPANGLTNLTVTLFAVEGGTYTNLAYGTNATLDLNVTNNNGSLTNAQVVTTISALDDVAVFKTGDTNVLATGVVHYAITATNAGPSTAQSVVVQDQLPAGTTLQTASGSYAVSNNIVIWAAANLPGGTATNFTLTLLPPVTGTLTNLALSTSPTPDSNTNNNNGTSSNSIVTTVVTPVADLAVGKSGVAAGVINSNFSYTISVTNLGPSTAANFAVTDSLPVGLVFVSAIPSTTTNAANQVIWSNLGTLASNAVTNLTLTVQATSRTVFTNIATVGGPTLDPNPTNSTSPPVSTSITNRPPVAVDDFASTARNVAVTIPVLANDSDPDGDALTIISTSGTNGIFNISGTNIVYTPTNAVPGTNVFTYTIIDGFGGTNSALVTVAVTNRPPVATNDVVAGTNNFAQVIFPLVNDTDPDGDALTITSAVSTNGIVTINAGSTNLTFIPTNSPVATITYTISDGFGGTSTATITVNVTGSADLAIGKFASSPTVYASSNLNYTISVTNLGANTASSVTVTDALPAGVTFVSASGSYATNNNVVTWSISSLTNRQITNLTVTVKAPASGTLTNTASVMSPTPDPVPTNNVTPPVTTGVTPVTDIIILNAGPTNVLANTTYTNTISVTNAGPSTATNVVVIDTLPDGTTVTNVLPILSAGSGTNYTVTYTAPPSGSLTNVANGTSGTFDPTLANNTNIVAVTAVIPVADLAVGKSATGPFVYGSNFGYTISVTNLGPSTASSVTVTDALPAGLRFVSATTGWKTNGSQVVWTNLGSLAAGATTNLSLTVYAGTNGVVSNTANVGGPTYDPNPTNNSSPPVLTTINPGTLIITANNTNKVYGQTITFAGTEFTLSGLIAGDSVSSVTLTSAGAASTAGVSGSPYSIIATNAVGSGLANYNIYYTNGSLTVTAKPLMITAGSTNKVYNTSLNLGTNAFTSIGLVTGETVGGVTLSSLGTVSNAPVGTYPITATNAVGGTFDPNNYSITYSNGVLTVTPAVPVLLWTNPPSIVYGTPLGTNQNNAVANVSGTNYVYNPTNGTILTVGTNTLRVVFTPDDTNYITVSNNVQLVVTPAPLVITANSTNKVYNTALSLGTTAFTSSGLVLNQTIGGVTLSSSGTVASAPVATYAITATNATGGTFNPNNYSITYSNGLLTVNPLPVIMYGVRGTDGTTNAAASILQVTNKAGGDVVIVASGVGGISSSNVGVWPITSFGTLALGGTAATNYTLVGASGWVSVTNTVPVTNRADIVVSVSGPSTVTVGDAFLYTVVVSNAGPTAAVNTLVTNVLPTNLVFSAASSGGILTNKNIVKWPVIPTLADGQVTNFTITVYSTNGITTNVATANPYNFIQTNMAPAVGQLTNRAYAFSATFDPNLTNNSASTFYTNAQVNTLIVPGVLSVFVATNTYPTNVVFTNAVTPIGPNLFIVGTNADNPQTGLHEENVTVTNIGTVPIHSIRLYVGGLRSGVTLYNATGTNNGVAYVEYDAPYDAPINPYPAANNHVTFQLEFYVTDWRTFTNSLSAVATLASTNTIINGTAGTIQKITDSRFVNDRFIIQFSSIPGRTYTVEYKDDLLSPTWKIAVPSIVASANVTQWYDDGPPKTDSLPSSVTNRFYQVIKNN
jgi:large repetitive protein